MPVERVSMRKIRDVLRLAHAIGMSRRLVGEATGIGKTAVGDFSTIFYALSLFVVFYNFVWMHKAHKLSPAWRLVSVRPP